MMNKVFLTKLTLNPRSSSVRKDIGNPREMHRTISGAFPPIENHEGVVPGERKTPRNMYNILYRLEFERGIGHPVLLVQSGLDPSWETLPADYLTSVATKEVSTSLGAIEDGMRLRFRLDANPTKRIGKSDSTADVRFKPGINGGPRRRVDLRSEEEQLNWLKRQGLQRGFQVESQRLRMQVPNIEIISDRTMNFRKSRERMNVTYRAVSFEGILVVNDREKLLDAIKSGIGQGKAYGLGMLSIAPVQ